MRLQLRFILVAVLATFVGRAVAQNVPAQRRAAQPAQNGAPAAPEEVAPLEVPPLLRRPKAAPAKSPLLRNLDPLTAGRQAYQQQEVRKQAQFSLQLGANDYARWTAGVPSLFGGRFPSLSYLYSDAATTPGWLNGLYGRIFEPWPYVPGDIYGYPFYATRPQPTGHTITLTSPNSYTYQPNYGPPASGRPPLAPLDPAWEALADEAQPAEAAELAAARLAFKRGDYAEAVRELEALAGDEPTTADLLRAQALLATGHYSQAADVVHRALPALKPDDWGLFVRDFRNVYPSRAAFTKCLRGLEKHVAERPKSAVGRFLLGYMYGYLGHTEQALRQLRQAADLAPDSPVITALIQRFQEAKPAPKPGPEAF